MDRRQTDTERKKRTGSDDDSAGPGEREMKMELAWQEGDKEKGDGYRHVEHKCGGDYADWKWRFGLRLAG